MRIIYLSLCLYYTKTTAFDPTRVDYCKIKCPNNEKDTHSSCNCRIFGDRYEVLDNMAEFRREILKQHNDKRNLIARGDEPTFPSAANMMALNYDLELEYMARCYAGRFEHGHDTCRTLPQYLTIGQNIGGITKKDLHHNFIEEWYNESKNVPRPKAAFVKNFEQDFDDEEDLGDDSKKVDHFSQMIWASNKYIGCARLWYPKNTKNVPFLYVLICNYAGDEGQNQERALALHRSVYEEGEPCSKCPKGSSCNGRLDENRTDGYDALCGDVNPVPTVKALHISNFVSRFCPKNFFLLVTLLAFLVY